MVHPLNNETRQMIQEMVVEEYEKIADEPDTKHKLKQS